MGKYNIPDLHNIMTQYWMKIIQKQMENFEFTIMGIYYYERYCASK